MAKVALIPCDEYIDEKVEQAISESIRLLGSLDKFVKKGDRVLLKPNLIMMKRPQEAATTHPSVVKAICKMLIAHGCEVIIGDSPGGPFNGLLTDRVYSATGMKDIAAETGAKLNRNYDSFTAENPDGLILKRIKMTDMLNDVDKVISVSKLKTHGYMTFTGAVKNQFGLIPGTDKAAYHLNMPEHECFADALIDICLYSKPVLSFMDGVVGMEGAGPTAGTPRQIGVIIASESPYHLDAAAASIIGLSPGEVPTLKRQAERGLIREDLSDIEFPAGKISDFTVANYTIPQVFEMLAIQKKMPTFVKNFASRNMLPRPEFDYKTCIGCGICAENCPAKVIAFRFTEEGKRPFYDKNKCIHCFCCEELCPKKAVIHHVPAISKLIGKRKKK